MKKNRGYSPDFPMQCRCKSFRSEDELDDVASPPPPPPRLGPIQSFHSPIQKVGKVEIVDKENDLLSETDGILDLVGDGLGGTTVDLVVLLTAGLVKSLLGGGL